MTPPVAPVVEPRVWTRQTQCALAALLTLLLVLLSWAATRSTAQRPLELQRAGTWQRIDLNEADFEQIRSLPGLDDVLARRILDYRASKGRFHSIDELEQIKGIGPAKLAQARLYLMVKSSPNEKNETVQVALRTSSEGAPSVRKEPPKAPLDVNMATLEQLQQLPGIGPVLAQRIVEARDKAPFRSVEDLRRVRGIGEITFKNIRPYVKVEQKQQEQQE